MSIVNIPRSSQISFTVNGKNYIINGADPTLSFNSWLRSQPGLTGTKVMCREGGCGCCVVALQKPSEKIKAVNSCLLPLCSVDGSHITTVEGVGSRTQGYDDIQTRLAEFGGSQCGYCTPGFIMSMHSLLEENSSPTQQQIEDNFDGNICRCTGYRSILDAMKCFASDADQSLKEKCQDIEDLMPRKCLSKRKTVPCPTIQSSLITGITSTWARSMKFEDLKSLLTAALSNHQSYKLLCGNTGSGVYRSTESFSLYIDVSQVVEFRATNISDDSIEFGSSVTLNELSESLEEHQNQSLSYHHLSSHIKKIASNPIRNCGSWAGNLMLKNAHNDFPSDMCVILEAAGAHVKVYDVTCDSFTVHTIFGNDGLVHLDMNEKVLYSVNIPKIAPENKTKMKTFKVMPRSQNAHAYVNAGFIVCFEEDSTMISSVKLVFGGISSTFDRALKTEEYLKGQSVNLDETLKGALVSLSSEVGQHCTDQYKLNLSLGLFYKFYLSLCDVSILGPGISSGIESLSRPISSGRQTFTTDPSTYPVSENIPKLTGILQTSGEAVYISDLPPTSDELHCDVVLSDIANADIDSIDTSAAEEMQGFVRIITGNNFPENVNNTYLFPGDPTQPIIAVDHVTHSGQVVAIVIAESANEARRIASAVKVNYTNEQKPLLSSEEAIEQKSFYELGIPDFVIGNPEAEIASAKHVVTGEFDVESQYHFYMETHVCRAQPTEDGGFYMEASTQWQRATQQVISYAFNIPVNKIEVTTKRLGGAYGGKATNSFLSSSVAALAAHVSGRPVRFHSSLKTCMSTLGNRTPFVMKYTVGFDDSGVMAGMDCSLYCNSGCSMFDGEADDPTIITNFADSAYFCANRRYKKYMLKTNLPSTSWCRAPGSLQLTAFADLMIEHIATYLNKDPIDVKYANLYKLGQTNLSGETLIYCNIRSVYQQLLTNYKIQTRQAEINDFNNANKWKKKGLAVTPTKFRVDAVGALYGVLITIYAIDGTVVVSHGGIDSGQGINTKVAQTVAYKLGIPVNLVTVQRTSTLTSGNSEVTGGSIASETVCWSAIGCCEILNARIEPVRAKMSPSTSWKALISKCYSESVDLTVSNMDTPRNSPYNSFGVTAAEVEYDVLTGEHQILKVDTVFDCGTSLNPSVDIGQVEGAFVMGIGFWLSEKMVYDEDTGKLLNDGTWEYKPPASKDIPLEWNIDLLKDTPNPLGVLRSKASGEPPMCMSVCVAIALKRAVEATRRDRGLVQYYPMPTPSTVDALYNSSQLNPIKDFLLK